MKSVWTKNLDSDSSRQIKDSFDAGGLLRKRLVEIINDKVEGSDRLGLSKMDYDTPNWALKRADDIGYKRAALEIINLIS